MLLADRIRASASSGAPRSWLDPFGPMACAWCHADIESGLAYYDGDFQRAETCRECGRESVAQIDDSDRLYTQGLRSPADLKYLERP